MRDRPQWLLKIFNSHVDIYSLAASSSKETDLKGILNHGSHFFMEGRVIFPLKMWNGRIYISCPFVETMLLRLICIWRIKSCSSSTRKKNKKAPTNISPCVFKIQTFRGSNDIWWWLGMEISRSDVDLQLCGGYGEFWNINELCTACKEECPQFLLH